MKTMVHLACGAILLLFGMGFANEYALNPTADTYVQSGFPSANYGTATKMIVKTHNPDLTRYSYLKFSLSSIGGSTITMAQLKIHVFTKSTVDTTPVTLNVNKVDDDSWSETGMTFDNRPAIGSYLNELSVTDTGWFTVDLTAAAISAANAGRPLNIVLNNPVAGISNGLDIHPREVTASAPVLLVKTCQNIASIADAYVSTVSPNTNHGLGDSILIKKGQGIVRNAYFKFNLSGMENRSVAAAKFWVYVLGVCDTGIYPVVQLAADNWTETGVTWNNQPEIPVDSNGSVTDGDQQFSAAGWYCVDVTQSVIDKAADNDTLSLAMVVGDSTGTNHMLYIASRTNPNSSLHPHLQVMYNSDRPALEDVTIRENYPTTNYGTADGLYCKRYDTFKGDVLFKFDVSNIPGEVTRAWVTVNVYGKALGPEIMGNVHYVPAASWSENSVTWNTKPAYGDTLDTYFLIDSLASGQIEFDVTEAVQQQTLKDGTFSIAVTCASPNSHSGAFNMTSRENAVEADRPVLRIQTDANDN